MSSDRPSLTAHVNQSNGGIELALSAVVFGLIGWWLDRRLGLTPILFTSFTLLGFVGSGISLYYRYRHQIDRLREETAELRQAAAANAAATSSNPPAEPDRALGVDGGS